MFPIHDIFPKALLSSLRKGKDFFSLVKSAWRLDRLSRRTKIYGGCGLVLLLALYFGILLAPGSFVRGTLVDIKEGMTLSEVADALEKENIIRSPVLFKGAVVLLSGSTKAISGDYFFNSRPTFLSVARRIARGLYGLAPVKLTIPEGANVFEIAWLAEKKLDSFDPVEFLRIAEIDEGYLFPDTYHFLPNTQAAVVHRVMRENFQEKIQPLESAIRKSGHNLNDIITMASLVEKEAHETEARRLIAGILWKRLAIGMPLQVDAVFSYINGKNTFELTLADLTDESLYNTYKYKGLPPGPISNPGLDSIIAAIYPKENPYLYYLADLSGVTHYSKTFEEHREKKFRYLP